MEISWNFVSPEKWEPYTRLPTICVSVTTTSCRYQFFFFGGGGRSSSEQVSSEDYQMSVTRGRK